MFAAAALNADPDAIAPEPGVMGWFAWKAGNTTDASTYVAYVAVPLFLILLTSRHAWRRWSAAVWLLLFAAIGFLHRLHDDADLRRIESEARIPTRAVRD